MVAHRAGRDWHTAVLPALASLAFLLGLGCGGPDPAGEVATPERVTTPEAVAPDPVPADTAREGAPPGLPVRPLVPVAQASEQLCEEPAYSPRTREPELAADQRRRFEADLERRVPEELRASGHPAEVLLWVCIDEAGRVRNSRPVSPGLPSALAAPAQQALRAVRFRPAMHRADTVPAWVQIPVGYP